ncbi:unnamed protein product [Angiostrongylus costaricensis]|uniref:RDD domain-containing protein n=1 Tax=Angiostrongylus costaricensis TaxID=334426 RepID=A0A0R3PK72_ANGCS|nr:unnamed protein product [Angiostrongylus costaricensis]
MDALKWHVSLRPVVDLFTPILGWSFGIAILVTSIIGSYIVSLFLFLLVGFLELIFEMRVRVSGDEIEYDKPALVVMNHRTRKRALFQIVGTLFYEALAVSENLMKQEKLLEY